jgi:nucleotide-binding universal stress UspA family protein
MNGVVLVAVEDSAAAFAAARAAVDLVAALGGTLVAVNVDADRRTERLSASGVVADVAHRRASAGLAALEHVARLGRGAGVAVSTMQRGGAVADTILAEARRCGAAVVVIARANRRGVGLPYIGAQAQQVLEFADVPVLVVPPP